MKLIASLDIEKTKQALWAMLEYLREHKEVDPEFESWLESVQEFGRGKYHAVSLSQHVRGLVYSKLSQQVKWNGVKKKLKDIDELFFHWNIDEINKYKSSYFFDGLTNLRVGRYRKSLCDNIHNNIRFIKALLSEYDADSPEYFMALKEGLNGYGFALVAEYLLHINVDRIKPDLHVKRFLMRFYNLKTEPTDMEVILWGKEIMENTEFNLTQIDAIIWSFCANANICVKSPKCESCRVRELCSYECLGMTRSR